MVGLRAKVLGQMGWTTSPYQRACALSCPSLAIYGPGLSGSGLYNALGRALLLSTHLGAAFTLPCPATKCYRSGCSGSFATSRDATPAMPLRRSTWTHVAVVVSQHQGMQLLCSRQEPRRPARLQRQFRNIRGCNGRSTGRSRWSAACSRYV
jgi:hypothetical protein